MSNVQSGSRYSDGFYESLHALLFHLAEEHPHHTLYQIFALRNGDRAGEAGGSIEHKVDADKVVCRGLPDEPPHSCHRNWPDCDISGSFSI
jgi:hypothetical protein